LFSYADCGSSRWLSRAFTSRQNIQNKTAAELLRSDTEFKKLFDEFWLVVIRELNDVHYQATEVDKITGVVQTWVTRKGELTLPGRLMAR
jgi:hypothetical protein